ncbi:MAG: hypothetical protein ACRCSK_07630 [Fusobacteriaceae bacterium]
MDFSLHKHYNILVGQILWELKRMDFSKLDVYIDMIEKGEIPDGKTFNEFALEFYSLTKIIPLSKYLNSTNHTSKLGKVMGTKKAGEVLMYTERSEEIRELIRQNGYENIPMLDYKSVMVLRKVDVYANWKRVFALFNGEMSVQEINRTIRPRLLPMEIDKLEKFVLQELELDDQEFRRFLTKFSKTTKNKDLYKALIKLMNQQDKDKD